MPVLIKAGIAGRYHSPERAAFGEIFRDKEGYWTAWDYNIAVIAYNTRLVSPADAPKKYEDFLEPRWKGNFALDMDPDKSIMAGSRPGVRSAPKISPGDKQDNVVVRKGHTLMAQLLCAGEFKAAIDLYLPACGLETFPRLPGGDFLSRPDAGNPESHRGRQENPSSVCGGAFTRLYLV